MSSRVPPESRPSLARVSPESRPSLARGNTSLKMFLSSSASMVLGLTFTILVFIASCSWRNFRSSDNYIQEADQENDPFLSGNYTTGLRITKCLRQSFQPIFSQTRPYATVFGQQHFVALGTNLNKTPWVDRTTD